MSLATAGYVLAGGKSTRMGRDKALLPCQGRTLLESIADLVRDAAGSVTVIGNPERYRHLGLRVVPDVIPDRGPLGGLLTALRDTQAEWNLVVACDMPNLTPALLSSLLREAQTGDSLALVADSGRLHPLCAVYHRGLLASVEKAVAENSLRMLDFVAAVQARPFPAVSREVANLNTPLELETH